MPSPTFSAARCLIFDKEGADNDQLHQASKVEGFRKMERVEEAARDGGGGRMTSEARLAHMSAKLRALYRQWLLEGRPRR